MRTAVVLAVLGATAHAEPRLEPMTFERALGLAGALAPISATRWAAAHERAGEIPRPWQPLELRVVPSWRGSPVDGLEGEVAIEQAIPLARSRAREVRDAHAAQRDAEALAATVEARLETAAAWIAGWNAREQLVAATRDRELARMLVTFAERAATAGTLTAPELADAKAFGAEAELRFLDAEGALADTAFATARSLGVTRAIGSDGALPSPPLPAATEWDALVASVRTVPAATARRLAARAERSRAAEERAARSTQLLVGASAGRDGPDTFVGGLTIGLALPHDRGQRSARTAESAARIADADATLIIARAASDLATALHDVEHTSRIVTEIDERLVPMTADAAARRQRAFELGEATTLELLTARRAASAAIARSREAHAAHAWARVHAWLLVEATR